ncbi:hypothetical protein [Paraburkholderia sp. A3RO-2L]|jgi:hypothetical protein|uniref:hypothetical protein n=1 Tax=unclassified Paraburkholderia TaxID=2615204 RepID=UPI003DA82E03
MAKSKHQGAEKTPVIPHEPEQQPDEEGAQFSPITRDEPSSSSFDDWDAGCIRMFND